MFHYENNILKFFATAEGYVNVTTGGRQGPDGPSYVFSYIYNYTDHLGNIRLSYTNNGINAAIIEENHYYPFGLKHKKYGMADPVPKLTYQYKYNGQERQDELNLNWDSYKWRNYDFAIGRFMSIDPITEEFVSISPYQFAHNNPVWKIELEGLEGVPTTGRDIINETPLLERLTGFDIFRNKQDLKHAETPQERTVIAGRIEGSQARLQGTSTTIEYMTYAVAAGGLGPYAALGAVYAAPFVGGALTSGYGSYSTWFAGTQLSSYISTAGYSGLVYQAFGTNSFRAGLVNATATAGGDYITGGFNLNNVDPFKTALAFRFNGIGANALSSSFQTSFEDYSIRPSTFSEFTLDFSLNKVSGKMGNQINSLGLSKFNSSMGTFLETVLQTGNQTLSKSVREQLDKEIQEKYFNENK